MLWRVWCVDGLKIGDGDGVLGGDMIYIAAWGIGVLLSVCFLAVKSRFMKR